MKTDITVHEVAEKSIELKKKLADILMEFTEETGCSIDDINIERTYQIGKGTVSYSVKTEVKLDDV